MTRKKFKPEKSKMAEGEEEELPKNSVNVFQCAHPDCRNQGAMEFEEFKHHLFSVHGLTAEQFKGSKRMTMHMDSARWFSSTYEWTLQSGLIFHQFVKMPRQKDDPMRSAY
jgi:hypothetical protein